MFSWLVTISEQYKHRIVVKQSFPLFEYCLYVPDKEIMLVFVPDIFVPTDILFSV